MPLSQNDSFFKTKQQFKAEYCLSNFTLYESERTGMRVVVVSQKSPKVYGLFALATEIHDDSGAPHTLEHLVFMGSRSYKYKGFLDRLANRAYSNTNAWTDVDNTVYMLDSAGWEGFALMLPIYLEHVLLPTLTDAGCYTEVHHVDGTGNDAGVVYSEMQGTQNTQGELMELRARRLLYAEESGFRAETGGLMEALRVLTADRIRSFHREMYQPKNLCLVLAGEVDHDNLLQILDKFEDDILDSVPRLDEPFHRPWIEHGKSTRLEESVVEVVEFPEEDDESVGEVLIGFLGPDYFDGIGCAALRVLTRYLSGSPVSLLDYELVEVEQLASSIEVHCETRPDMAIWFTLTGVETQNLELAEKRFFEILKDAAAKPFDMEYMRNWQYRYKREIRSQSENALSFFSDEVIRDHLFADRDGVNLKKIATLEEYDALESWDDPTWRAFLSKWLSDAPHVSILGKPSAALAKNLAEAETARVKQQQERLGQEGLKNLDQKLEAARAENDLDIPAGLLKKFPIPSTDSIHFFPTTTARSGFAREMGQLQNNAQQQIDRDKTNFPLFIHFEHVPSNFVHIAVSMNTHSADEEVLPLLPLLIENFFDTPLQREGKRVEFEDVVNDFELEAVDYSFMSATAITNPELLRARFEVEPHNYESAIAWMRDFIFNTIFDPVRLKAALAKLLADIPDAKRNGYSMAASVINLLHSTRKASTQNTLVKAVHLRQIRRMLKTDPQAVVDKLIRLRDSLTKLSGMRIYVAGDLESGKIKKPVSSWEAFTEGKDLSNLKLDPVDQQWDSLTEAGRNPGSFAHIVPMSTIDSSYGILRAKGPDSFDHPRLPALVVAMNYLEAVEGPLWVAVRGTGLAYGVNFGRTVAEGLIQYTIYRSPDAYRAFSASKKMVESYASGEVELDELALQGAVSAYVYDIASQQDSMFTAAVASFSNQVIRGLPKDWHASFMKKVRSATMEEVKSAMKDIILPLFQPETCDMVITCSPLMQEKIEEGFKSEGFQPEVRSLSSFQDAYSLDGDGELDEDSEETDDEDGDWSTEEENGVK